MEDPYGSIDRLALNVMADHKKLRPEVFAHYRGEPNDPWLEETRKQIGFLFDAANINSPAMFVNYIAWAKIVLLHAGVPSEIFREKLEIIRQQCGNELKGSFAVQVDGILGLTLDRYPGMPESEAPFIDDTAGMGTITGKYLEQVLRGERQAAQETIRDAMARGIQPKDIYINVIQRAQYEVGRRWQLGQISVAQEHYATELAHQILSQVNISMTRHTCRKGNLVVTCVGNEMHGLGPRMVADFLEMDGWDVSYLGANTPHADIISMLKERNAKALLVSATMGYNVKRVRVLIRHIRADPRLEKLKVMVGGYAFNSVEGLWSVVGADGFARDAEETIRVVNELLK